MISFKIKFCGIVFVADVFHVSKLYRKYFLAKD